MAVVVQIVQEDTELRQHCGSIAFVFLIFYVFNMCGHSGVSAFGIGGLFNNPILKACFRRN